MKIIIVDDEPLIHLSIEKLIHTLDNTLEIFHAYNGQEMLALIQTQRFSLALVDIKMPGISGLEAIKEAKVLSPFTHYYIMTGFDEFEYAKQAIKLKVDDYLLKPLDQKTLEDTIETVRQLDFASQRERKTIFRNWLESTLNRRKAAIEKYDNYYGCLLLVTIDNPHFPRETLLEKFNAYNDFLVSTFTEHHILLFAFSEDVTLLRNLVRELSQNNYEEGITLFASSITQNYDLLACSLPQLLRYSALRVLLGIEKFYHLEILYRYEEDTLKFSQRCIHWQTAYLEKNYSQFTNQSDLLCAQLKNFNLLPSYEKALWHFLTQTLRIAIETPLVPEYLHKHFNICAKQFLNTPKNKSLAPSIITFIQEHYCDSNLTIANLADRFGLSPNYITTLIKQEVGIRYNDYITQLRLRRAKELLISTSQSVKEITTACGYYSQSHFTKLFINQENCTPIEYRKIHRL